MGRCNGVHMRLIYEYYNTNRMQSLALPAGTTIYVSLVFDGTAYGRENVSFVVGETVYPRNDRFYQVAFVRNNSIS